MSLTIRSTMNNQTAAQGIDNTDKNTDNSKQTRNRKTINASELNLKPYNDNQIDAKRLRAREAKMIACFFIAGLLFLYENYS